MPLQDQIQEIIDRRRDRVSGINARIEKLDELSREINSYDRLRSSIVDAQGNLKEDSPFAPMLLKHPEMVMKIKEATTPILNSMMSSYKKELNRLRHIYSRDSISVMVFGWAGAGKSTLIQSITGLDNNVVLAADDRSEGIHCTGASSFIYNAQSFEARVYFYTQEELLKIFNYNFLRLQKKFCGTNSNHQLNNFDEIQDFVPADYGLPNDANSASLNLFRVHFQRIKDLSSGINPDDPNHAPLQLLPDDEGCAYLQLLQPELVQQYVAQYNGKSGVNLVEYHNYIAVKRVDVFTPFPNSGTVGKIVLMDNVGLGDPTNEQATQDTMFESIATNSDAVVFLYSPDAGAGFVADQNRILNIVRNMRTKDFATNEERMDKNQLFMLVNKVVTPQRDNSANCDAFKRWFHLRDDVHGGGRDETCIIVSAIDPEETNNALVSVLDQMIAHLPEIDSRMEDKVTESEERFLNELNQFLNKVNQVTLSSNAMGRTTFFHLFEQLYHTDLRLNLLDMLKDAQDCLCEVSSDLNRQLMTRCTSEKASQKIEKIDNLIDKQLAKQPYAINAYLNVAAFLRHAIPNDFRAVDTDLKKKIEARKALPLEILYTTGRLSNLLKKNKHITDDVSATVEWGKKFIELFLDEEDYPLLHKLFSDLLAFNQNVEGFLLPKIIKHLNTFDNAPANIPKGKEKKVISYYLDLNLGDAFTAIRNDLENFVEAPNEAIYFALDEFVYGLVYSEEVTEEARKLYDTFYETIWKQEVAMQQQQHQAFNEWIDQKNALSVIRDFFAND